MKYHEYLATGCPIATGVIKGACRHFVKDRLERSGMRWTTEGAEAMLTLRSITASEAWNKFQNYCHRPSILHAEHAGRAVTLDCRGRRQNARIRAAGFRFVCWIARSEPQCRCLVFEV